MLLMFVKLGGFLALVFLRVMLVLRIVTGGAPDNVFHQQRGGFPQGRQHDK
jgi:hypothetical protein